MKLTYSAAAVRQIKDIYLYIARDNVSAARKVVDRILEVAEFAAAYPKAGHATFLRGVRAIPANPYPYIVYVRRSRSAVRLVRVLHAARQRPALREEGREYHL